MIFSHNNQEWKDLNVGTGNGAFYYSNEIVKNIIPKIKTDRNWVTINVKDQCFDHSIVFIHNNKEWTRYKWLSKYKDLILICSSIKTLEHMIEMFPNFHCIYIPLSIDKKYVEKFKVEQKTKNTAYFGRIEKCPKELLENKTVDKIYNEERDSLLKKVAEYKTVYAIGRCALEAKALKCKVISHKGEYEHTTFKLLDNSEIVPELQRLLNEIDMVK